MTEYVIALLREAVAGRAAEARAACDESMRLTGQVDPTERAVAETHGPGLLAVLSGPTAAALLQAVGDADEFAPAHFEFAAVPSHRLTDPRLQRYVQKLKTNTQNERATAATLLNAALATQTGRGGEEETRREEPELVATAPPRVEEARAAEPELVAPSAPVEATPAPVEVPTPPPLAAFPWCLRVSLTAAHWLKATDPFAAIAPPETQRLFPPPDLQRLEALRE